MKLFQIQYDGQYLYLLAPSFGAAVKRWRARMLEDAERDGDWDLDDDEEPEQVVVLSDSESELHFPGVTP